MGLHRWQKALSSGRSDHGSAGFDEIVDGRNSSEQQPYDFYECGTLSYAGGADTNVLYFTGGILCCQLKQRHCAEGQQHQQSWQH